jgi:hypothetical protein
VTVIEVDIVIDIIMVQPIEIIITKIDQHLETIGKIMLIFIRINKNVCLVDLYHIPMIIMVIIPQEIPRMVVITIVHHVLHLILDQFHLEMVHRRIIVIIIIMMIIKLRHH